jgi:hypothetical protein
VKCHYPKLEPKTVRLNLSDDNKLASWVMLICCLNRKAELRPVVSCRIWSQTGVDAASARVWLTQIRLYRRPNHVLSHRISSRLRAIMPASIIISLKNPHVNDGQRGPVVVRQERSQPCRFSLSRINLGQGPPNFIRTTGETRIQSAKSRMIGRVPSQLFLLFRFFF